MKNINDSEFKKNIKENFLKILIKNKIVSTYLSSIQVSDDFSFLENNINGKKFFLEKEEIITMKNLKFITFEEFNKFYYKWLSKQLEIIRTKRRNKEVIIEEIDVFIEINDSSRYLQIESSNSNE